MLPRPNLKLNSRDISNWFNAIRDLNDRQRDVYMDAFWSGQLDSKAWLVQELTATLNDRDSANIYIFGGWIGVLSSMLFQSDIQINQIVSVDLDERCQTISETVCQNYHDRFTSVTEDMKVFDYFWDRVPTAVINTSCEHVDQDTYYQWYDKIYPGTIVVAQSNNYFDCDQHVRCSKNLRDFEDANCVTDPVYSGELEHDIYTRYMSIWTK
jgi:hypothetical protein